MNTSQVLLPLVGLTAIVVAADDDDDDDVPAAEWTRTADPAALTFTVSGPGDLGFEGATDDLEVQESDQGVVVVVDLRALTSGEPVRDLVMREQFLEVEQFPEARLEVARADLVMPEISPLDPPPLDDDISGSLTLHGEQRAVPFHYEATCNAAWLCDVVGDVVVVMTEFGIPLPRWQGQVMQPEVKIHAEFQVQRSPPPLPPPDTEPEPPPPPPPPSPTR
jgi:polyisoprenoid-binding protein YceI